MARVGGREIGVMLDRATGAGGGPQPLPAHGRAALPGHGTPTARPARPAATTSSERRVLHCPWHGWEFDLESGRCPEDDRMRVAVYPVRVEDGRVLVEA